MSDGEDRDFAARASPEWFACFQTFFFKVNRQACRMCVSVSAGGTRTISPTVMPVNTIAGDGDVVDGHVQAVPAAGGGDNAEGMIAGAFKALIIVPNTRLLGIFCRVLSDK